MSTLFVKKHPALDALYVARASITGEPDPGAWETMTEAELDAWVAAELAAGWQPQAPEPGPAPVPEEVALWRIKAVADLADLTPSIEAGIEAMPEPQRTIARRAWHEGNVMVRTSPLVLGLAAQLGLTAPQIDDLFRQAEALPA